MNNTCIGNYEESKNALMLQSIKNTGVSRNLLVITVKSAERLKKVDLLSKSDPYVEVQMG
jgi:Ca2+-dependent lipid-binding protein